MLSGFGSAAGNARGFRIWLDMTFLRLDHERWGEIAAICWNLWQHCNDVIWRGQYSTPRDVLFRGINALNLWCSSFQQGGAISMIRRDSEGRFVGGSLKQV